MTYFSKPKFVQLAANVATALFAVFLVVQILAAAGAFPVSMLWGGRQTELTVALRLTSVVAAVVLGVFIYIMRYRAGLVGSMPQPMWIRIAAWVVTGYMALNTLGNFASVSPVERLLFGPLAILLTAACLVVAASPTNS
ncbi:MAG: hypothetical protein R3E31_17715 [Chloroflexota bacterium]